MPFMHLNKPFSLCLLAESWKRNKEGCILTRDMTADNTSSWGGVFVHWIKHFILVTDRTKQVLPFFYIYIFLSRSIGVKSHSSLFVYIWQGEWVNVQTQGRCYWHVNLNYSKKRKNVEIILASDTRWLQFNDLSVITSTNWQAIVELGEKIVCNVLSFYEHIYRTFLCWKPAVLDEGLHQWKKCVVVSERMILTFSFTSSHILSSWNL